MSPPNPSFTNMQLRNEQTLTDIQGLQTIEQDLFTQLNTGLNQKTLTPAQQNSLIARINEVSQMRINLYKNLASVYSFFGTNVMSSNAVLAEQTVAIGVVEQELNTAKERLKEVEDEANDKMRMIQINTYYGDKYNDHTNILKTIILFCIPILILTILYKAEIIPSFIFSILIIIIVFWGCINIGYKIINSLYRDNMNYDEYVWDFDKSTAPSNNTSGVANRPDPWGGALSRGCLGPNCCYKGTKYEKSLNQCVPNDIAASIAAAAAAAAKNSHNSNSGSSVSGQTSDSHFFQGGYGGL